MIFEGSRYEFASVVRVLDRTRGIEIAVYEGSFVDQQRFQYFEYATKPGDRLDVLADHFYGDPELWWRIARANPEIPYPDDIEPNTIIRVPNATV